MWPGRPERHWNRFAIDRWSSVSRLMDRTFIICKPDAVERGLVGEILGRFERRNLTIVAAELRTIDAETAGRHYAEHADKPFFGELVEFITRGPALLAVIEGPEDTWKVARTMIGATNPRDAAPGTIRGDLGILFTENLIHGSDGPEAAVREIGIFFPGL
jgi:nucleoside-diphosphate kinase